MKKNKYVKIIMIVLLIIAIFILFSNVYAATCTTCGGSGHTTGTIKPCPDCSGTGDVNSGTVDTNLFKPTQLTEDDYGSAFEIAGTIVQGMTILGTVIAILGILILGIKYMIGSVEQKAEYKKTMWPYLVGCIFIFAITRIVSIIYNLVSQI